MELLKRHIEAIVFCSEKPVTVTEIKECMSEMFDADIEDADISTALSALTQKYLNGDYAFAIYNLSGGFQFLTKPEYQTSLSIYLKNASKKRISASALETLAIIAYKQPISKSHIEQIRGVNCDYAVQRLLEKELVEIKGKSESIGKPLLYGTSEKFLEYFGINTLADLPMPKDFAQIDNEIGDNKE